MKKMIHVEMSLQEILQLDESVFEYLIVTVENFGQNQFYKHHLIGKWCFEDPNISYFFWDFEELINHISNREAVKNVKTNVPSLMGININYLNN